MLFRSRHIEVTRTARYWILGEELPSPSEVWFVLHGYRQLARRFLRRFERLADGTRAVVAPEAIARFSTPGIKRDIAVFGANLFDSIWQSGHLDQVGRFYCDAAVRDRHLKVLSHYSFDMRPAFFGLNAVLRAEIEARAANLPRMRDFQRPVLIVFGAEDKTLNPGVAREFGALFPNTTLHQIGRAHV